MNQNMPENRQMNVLVQLEQQEVQLLTIYDYDIHPRFQRVERAILDAFDPLDCWHYG